jgi:hypothetical protein
MKIETEVLASTQEDSSHNIRVASKESSYMNDPSSDVERTNLRSPRLSLILIGNCILCYFPHIVGTREI